MDINVISFIKEHINKHTVSLYYKIADIYKIYNLAAVSFSCIERCFTTVMDTESFLELDIKLIRKILYSSELHITSELEVFNAVDNWICHNTKERCKFAKCLLLTVRLSLLSDPALNYILSRTTSPISFKVF